MSVLVVVEIMPDWCRDSHRACHNWGTWPFNGAERYVTSDSLAKELTDNDEYNHIVQNANQKDIETYQMYTF